MEDQQNETQLDPAAAPTAAVKAAREGEAGPFVVLTKPGWRRWLSAHPWIFRDDLETIDASNGDSVAVVDFRGRELGRGLYSGASKIALRVATREPGAIDERQYLTDRLGRAAARRPRRGLDEAERLVASEADDLPGLIVDRYADVIVVQHAIPYWENRRELVLSVLRQVYSPRAVVSRDDFSARGLEGLTKRNETEFGEAPGPVEIREGAVKFSVDPSAGQKTGFFLDQRENRERVARLAKGSVLDMFCADGSFALHCAKAGAEKVMGVDSSGPSLERARVNAERNGCGEKVEWVKAMAFDDLRDRAARGEQHDLVILDPPAFAKNRADVTNAFRGYVEINSRALRIVKPGGYLATFSCSYNLTDDLFGKVLHEAAIDSRRRVELVERLRQSQDHPILLTHPESSYLKGAILRVE